MSTDPHEADAAKTFDAESAARYEAGLTGGMSAEDRAAHHAALASEVQMAEIDTAFYRLAVKERDFERAKCDRLTSERDAALTELAQLKIDLRAGNASDGHHTHRELLAYRLAYHAHAAHGWHAEGIEVSKSWLHDDGEPCFGGGWFIVTAQLPTGQVTNHYRSEHWDLFAIPEVEMAPPYDGHTPASALERLMQALQDRGTR